jgi:N utilization substance protein A
VAVKSNDPEVGAVGTCVGHMGGRIQNIVKALGNEKIDIIEWIEDPMELLVSALKPAKISKIRLEENENEKKAQVFVAEDQLSLAIGKGGQNVRLASKLTGWSIDIQTEKSSFAENLKSAVQEAKAQEEKVQPEEAAAAPVVAVETVETPASAPETTEAPAA